MAAGSWPIAAPKAASASPSPIRALASKLPGVTAPRRFPRSARLKHRRLIRALFDRSRSDVGSLAHGCVRAVYRLADQKDVGSPVQAGFSPGRMPKATRRNRVKRILREVYREHQHVLIDLFSCSDHALTVMFLYRGSFPEARVRIPADLAVLIDRLADRLNNT